MMKIYLTKGYVAIVDDEDFPAISKYKWQTQKSERGGAYARRTGLAGETRHLKTIMMHTDILAPPAGMIVDHISGNTLDNRRANLRLVNKYQHAQNTKTRVDNSSGHRGVSFCKCTGRWRAEISADGRRVRIGRFDSAEAAATAYRDFAERMHKEFSGLARLRDGVQMNKEHGA